MPFNQIEQIRSYTRKHEPEDQSKVKRDNQHIQYTTKSTNNSDLNIIIMSSAIQIEDQQHKQSIRPTRRRTTTIMTSSSIVKKSPTICGIQSNIRSKRVIFNPSAISLVLICHLICNHLFSETILTTTRIAATISAGQQQLHGHDSNLINSSINQSGSLFQMVSANPAPVASPSSARSATSVSHRVPPINGSMFGKRSLDNLGKSMAPSKRAAKTTSTTTSTTEPFRSSSDNYNDVITEIIENFLAKNNASKYVEIITGLVLQCCQTTFVTPINTQRDI